jgi:phosphatidylserine decarboxylase
MTLHREGRRLIPLSALGLAALVALIYAFTRGTAVGWLGHVAAGLGMLLLALVINFFRKPHFTPQAAANEVLAPAMGKVVVIEEVEEPLYFQARRKQVSIFMSPLDVHINYSPIAGRVSWLRYYPGQYLMAFNPKSSTANEQSFFVLEQGATQLGLKQIAGFLARRIRWYINEGSELSAGQELGFIRFGSRVDVLLPPEATVCVALGQRVTGGRTILARLPA